MSTIAIFSAIVGFSMVVVALGMLIPRLALDSPLESLLSLIGRCRAGNFLKLAHNYIRDEWPDSKGIAILLYGGLILLVGPVLVCYVIPDLIRKIFSGTNL